MNIQPNCYYVYCHKRKTDGSVFYIGKGKGRRAFEFSKTQRSAFWFRVYKKHGVEVEIIYSNLTENEAFDLEIIEISKYKRVSDGGILVNLTNGGDGSNGRFLNLRTRGLISVANKGFKHSEETKKRMSESRKGVLKGPFSEEHKKNIRISANKRKPVSQEVGKKISAKLTGVKRDPDVVKRIALAKTGKLLTEQTKQKISMSLIGIAPPNLGIPHSEKAKINMSNSQKGRQASEETKAKMSATRTGKKRGPYSKSKMISKPKLFIVAGPAGCGKTYICSQLDTSKCTYLKADNLSEMGYTAAIFRSYWSNSIPVVLELTMGVSTFIKHNNDLMDISAVFINETDEVLFNRILSRGGKVTEYAAKRNAVMVKRAAKYGEFYGTSQEVLDYLKAKLNEIL